MRAQQQEKLIWSLLPCVCLLCPCVSEEILCSAAAAFWLGTSFLQAWDWWKAKGCRKPLADGTSCFPVLVWPWWTAQRLRWMAKSCRDVGLSPRSAVEGDHARERAEGCLGEELVDKVYGKISRSLGVAAGQALAEVQLQVYLMSAEPFSSPPPPETCFCTGGGWPSQMFLSWSLGE